MRLTHLLIALAATSVLSACGGGGGGGGGGGFAAMATLAAAGNGTTEALTGSGNTLVTVSAEAPGTRCASGGVRIDAGLDSDGSGVLSTSEVSSTQYVCHGAAGGATGANGLNALVDMVDAPGCPTGGKAINAGMDVNGNGTLEADEITSTDLVCNGATGAGLNWVTVTDAAVQSQSNTAYVASNDTAQMVLTLPANPAVGDVVRVSGAGAGGWKIAQNAGQSVYTKNLGGMGGASWVGHEPTLTWYSVASSADGSKLVAAVTGVIGGQLYTSVDSGVSWTVREPNVNRSWASVASSADGLKLVAVVTNGQIYTSSNGGVDWTPRESARYWSAVASSADGSHLAAAEASGFVYTSSDGGETWTRQAPVGNWNAVASSADGHKLVGVQDSGQVYTSSDSGANWTLVVGPVGELRGVASSADGSKLAVTTSSGRIYLSSDSGATWEARQVSQLLLTVASSADGRKLVATGDQIYTSSDSGATWTARESSRAWTSAAMSADGSKLVATVFGGQIYTSIATTIPGTSGWISGAQSDSIELQYVGNGMFTVLNHEGSLTIE